MAIKSTNIESDFSLNHYKTIKDNSEVEIVVNETSTTISGYFSSQSLNSFAEDNSVSDSYTLFGQGVTVVNSRKILIGTPSKTFSGYLQSPGDVGAVYEFTRTDGVHDVDGSEWVQTAQITASDFSSMNPSTSEMHFGHCLQATGSHLIVGAPHRCGPSGSYTSRVGAVYVFKSSSSGYAQEAFFRPLTGSGERFGEVVRFNATPNKFAVGVPSRDETYIFNSGSGGWSQEAILTSSLTSYASPSFGGSIAYSGSYLAVGAPNDRPGSTMGAGSACLFKSSSSGWSEIGIFSSSAPSGFGFYGRSLAFMSNKRLVVGEEFGEISGNATGSVQVFSFTDAGVKTLHQTILNPLTGNSGRFGRFVDAYNDGTFISVSRPISGDNTTDSSSNEGNRAVLVYQSGASGYSLLTTLTRDTSLATYYGSSPGKWIYSIDSNNTASKWYSMLSMKDGLIIHGIAGAADSKFHDDDGSPFNYGFGEFRSWRNVLSTTTTTIRTAPPIRFSAKAAFNIRGQTVKNPYSVTLK